MKVISKPKWVDISLDSIKIHTGQMAKSTEAETSP